MMVRTVCRGVAFWMAALSLAALFSVTCVAARANDDIFPPRTAAASFIHFDGRGFIINGKRTYVRSGSFHYARVPRALWRDRLEKMKRAGFNTVQTYVFWNYQEPRPGQFRFTGRADLDAFLKLARSVGLYATVRMGPYDCAEWDSGGYPVFLRFIPGLQVRADDPAFIHALDKFWKRLIPIVAENQINHGGNVILVQMENEDPQGWGTDMPNAYFRHMYNMTRRLGIQVPIFFSGLHHGSDPAGNKPWSSRGRTSPWYSTETWTGWYNLYGRMNPGKFRFTEDALWHNEAFGGNGLNLYMLVGSTNFGHWNNDEMRASYDYAAGIGQLGDLRPLYYRYKRINYFARSFQAVLADSDNATAQYADFATGRSIQVYARKSPQGTLVFLANTGNVAAAAHLKGGGVLHLHPAEFVPLVRHFAISKWVSIQQSRSRILSVVKQGKFLTVILYGAGEGNIEFKVGSPDTVGALPRGFSWKNKAAGLLDFNVSFAQLMSHQRYTSIMADEPFQRTIKIGAHTLRIFCESYRQEHVTWLAGYHGLKQIVIGPTYVDRIATRSGAMALRIQQFDRKAPNIAVVYGASAEPAVLEGNPPGSAGQIPAIHFTHWQMHTLVAPAAATYSDAAWVKTRRPRQMGFDHGYPGAYTWYRCAFNWSGPPQKAVLPLSHFADWAAVFLNGQLVGQGTAPINPRVHLIPGKNTLAIFTVNNGRNKLFAYIGPIRDKDRMGLWGTVNLYKTAESTVLSHWRMKPVASLKAGKAMIARNHRGGHWKPAVVGQDAFDGQPGFAWFHTRLPAIPAGYLASAKFDDVDDNGWIYLNGKLIGSHRGWGRPFTVSLATARHNGANSFDVLVQNTSGAGGLMAKVVLHTDQPLAGVGSRPLTPWRMRGGLGNWATHWRPLGGHAPGVPCMYQAHFRMPKIKAGTTGLRAHLVYRVSWGHLFGGDAWINGHNLGRYPDPQCRRGLYIPSCWLKSGTNSLTILDEMGGLPDQVYLRPSQSASRWVGWLKPRK